MVTRSLWKYIDSRLPAHRGVLAVVLAAFSMLTAGCAGEGRSAGSTGAYLAELDAALADREEFASGREAVIREAKGQLSTVKTDSDAYNICRTLFSAYRNYRVDSALLTARQRLDMAAALGDRSKAVSASLNLAECLSAAAHYSEALGILDTVGASAVEPYQRQYLFKIYCDTYGRMAASDGLENDKLRFGMLCRQYRDSAMMSYQATDRHRHSLKARSLLDAGYPAAALKEMENARRVSSDTAEDPKMLYESGLIYRALGRRQEEIDALARSSLLYIRSGQRDYPSLMDLADALNRNGDPARAYRYIMAALEDASFCNSRSRTSQIQELVPLISEAHASLERESLRRVWKMTAVIILLAIANGGCFLWAYSELRKKRRMGLRLEEMNRDLHSSNVELERANRGKVLFISRLFAIYSDYIERIDAYRKKVRQLLKMSQPGSALDYLESNKIVADELKDMYRRFDAMFVELYPDFIPTYNSLVHPGEQLDPDSRSLPAKVRVLALMKTGVTEPADIARLLHYTPQTIYNYCSHLRAASRVPYVEFEEAMLGSQR
ncbi:MAG: hypothetical protein K2L59_00930 [Muribaculaceae bacterium]|nr:hypothetical protein [Muribaculaceae bacterium]